MTEALEKALADLTIHSMPVPRAFQWAGALYRGGRTQEQLEADWPTLPLETRVSLTACLMGGPVYSPAPNKQVSDAYLSLCQHGTMTRPPLH